MNLLFKLRIVITNRSVGVRVARLIKWCGVLGAVCACGCVRVGVVNFGVALLTMPSELGSSKPGQTWRNYRQRPSRSNTVVLAIVVVIVAVCEIEVISAQTSAIPLYLQVLVMFTAAAAAAAGLVRRVCHCRLSRS